MVTFKVYFCGLSEGHGHTGLTHPFDIQALSGRFLECQQIKMGGLAVRPAWCWMLW